MEEYKRRTRVVDAPSTKPTLEVLTKALKQNAKEVKKNKSVGCAHFLGHLKTRLKDSSIPDGCLTCSRILECMYRSKLGAREL